MANPLWPAALPQEVLARGYQEALPDIVLRSSMDAGPDKTRRRYTAGVGKFQAQQRMTPAQLETFRTFFNGTLLGGALRFEWTHPTMGTQVVMRFASPPPPTWVPAGGGDFLVSMSLEVLP